MKSRHKRLFVRLTIMHGSLGARASARFRGRRYNTVYTYVYVLLSLSTGTTPHCGAGEYVRSDVKDEFPERLQVAVKFSHHHLMISVVHAFSFAHACSTNCKLKL